MRLLFITSNRIGDAVLSTGLLAHLIAEARDQGGMPEVTVAAGPASTPLFAGVPGLAGVIPMHKRKGGLHWFRLLARVGWQRWDVVVDLRRSALAYCLRADRRLIVPKSNRPLHRVHLLARMIGREAAPPAPTLWPTDAARAEAARLAPEGPPILALAPTANWRGKIWPAERFAALAGRLCATDGPLPGARVAVLGGPGEDAQAAPVLDAIPPERRIDLVGRIDLLTAAALLERARLFVGNDSGLMHIAAAMGTPTLGLFGPSKTELYAPWGPHAAYVRTPESFGDLTGGPDYDHRTTGSLMGGLTLETVEDAARDLLTRTAREEGSPR
ncbi:glycosyltransferase family 9 protein [Marivibrio halodurans]|uniref:Glycosyltransferase family 9 protein n=1 Tax=Marivibrio halodurans TaxID=2039722 RepID=A0A8J7V3X5_9PROT|nr:glycosyltransferase family 9 protein [Marivibrio halodurans]MBP5857074.1 glycosyltransferase family 9 protein [Marivibrio halodurans]